MRGYGIPQAMWAVECHTEDICAKLNMDPLEFRRKNLMPVGYKDAFSKNELYSDTFNQCLDKGIEVTDYLRKYKEYQNQTGDIRRGIGMAVFWYNTAVWPISLETSSCRMVLNQDGSLQVQLGETEIGQGVLHLQKCSRNADYRFFHRHMWPGEMIVSPHKTFDRTARKQYRITLLFTFLNQPVTSVNLFLFIRSYFY